MIKSKLVRDNVPELEYYQGKIEFQQITGEELTKALKEKLIEEATEVSETDNLHDFYKELSDVLIVIDCLMAHMNIDGHTVYDMMLKDMKIRGGFLKGFTTEEPIKLRELWKEYQNEHRQG